jgi:DNA-binding HxlR family transcriptional regulator
LIKAAIPDITDRMLSERLRSLESEELLTRRVVPESPVRVEYELTEKGRSLQSSLNEIGAWAERWISLDGDAESRAATESKARKRRA